MFSQNIAPKTLESGTQCCFMSILSIIRLFIGRQEPLRLFSSMDRSVNILLICSTRSPTIKKGPRTSLLTGSIGNSGRPILIHGNFWEYIKSVKKINFIRKFLEKHTKSMTKFGFPQNINLNQKNSFFLGRDRTLSLRELRKLITKLVNRKGVINDISSTTSSSNHSWKRNRKRRASVEPHRFVRRIFTRNHWKLTSGSYWIRTQFPGRQYWCQEIGYKSRSLPCNRKRN